MISIFFFGETVHFFIPKLSFCQFVNWSLHHSGCVCVTIIIVIEGLLHKHSFPFNFSELFCELGVCCPLILRGN